MATTQFMACASATYGFEFFTATAGTATIDSAVVRNGPRSFKLNTNNPAVATSARKSGVLADAGRRLSCWLSFPSVAPAAATNILSFLTSGLLGVIQVKLETTSVLSAIGVGATTVTGTTVLLPNTWYCVSVAYTITSTALFEIRVYLNGALEITISSNGTLTRTGSDSFRFNLDAAAGVSFVMNCDELYIDDGTNLADPAPAGQHIAITAKQPAANNINQFDTAVGANPANRWTNVNERPISLTNGWEEAATANVQESFGLQSASAGDLDISARTLIARTAWIWAKASIAASGTPMLIDNQVQTAVSLTTSAALYTAITDDVNYPSQVGGIGMVSTNTSADTFLYECGTMIAYVEVDVTFDAASSSAYEASLSTYSWNHTVAARDNRVLIVSVSIFLAGNVTGVTFNGVALTNDASSTVTNGVYRSEVWYLIGPPVGTWSVVVTLNASLTSIANACSYYNADQTAPIEARNTNTGTGNPASVAVTTVASGAIVFANLVTPTASGVSSASGQNSRDINSGALGTSAADDEGPVYTPASTTLTWNGIGVADTWAASGISIKPTAAVARNIYPYDLAGVYAFG